MKTPWLCPTEERWTRYLLDPKLSGREKLARHLETCPYCRVVVAARERELGRLADQWAASGKPDVFYLAPMSEFSDLQADAGVLAAEGKRATPPVEAATLSSPRQEVLLRVVRDQQTGDVWLYLMSGDPDCYRNVIIKPFGEDREYITDDLGGVNLGLRDWPGSEQMTAEVHLPKASFTMQPLEDEEPHSVVLESPGGDRIKVTYEGDQRNRRLEIQLLDVSNIKKDVPLKVAVRGLEAESMLRVQTIISQRALFEGLESGQGLEIYLYQ